MPRLYWWSWDLSAAKVIGEAINKARCTFFTFGVLGAYQVNPQAIFPVLLYSCENWILTDANIDSLKFLQSEISRRILRLSKFHYTVTVRLALQWPSIASRILSWKLSLLSRVSSDGESIVCQIFLF